MNRDRIQWRNCSRWWWEAREKGEKWESRAWSIVWVGRVSVRCWVPAPRGRKNKLTFLLGGAGRTVSNLLHSPTL